MDSHYTHDSGIEPGLLPSRDDSHNAQMYHPDGMPQAWGVYTGPAEDMNTTGDLQYGPHPAGSWDGSSGYNQPMNVFPSDAMYCVSYDEYSRALLPPSDSSTSSSWALNISNDTNNSLQISPEISVNGGEQPLLPLHCPHGCQAVTFGRKYDLMRHVETYHVCPHPSCKDRRFSRGDLEAHSKEYHKRGFYLECGSCEIYGQSFKGCPRNRTDKLKEHFKKSHKKQIQKYDSFQCKERPCYAGKRFGGVFFASQDDLEQHLRNFHGRSSPDRMSLSDHAIYDSPTTQSSEELNNMLSSDMQGPPSLTETASSREDSPDEHSVAKHTLEHGPGAPYKRPKILGNESHDTTLSKNPVTLFLNLIEPYPCSTEGGPPVQEPTCNRNCALSEMVASLGSQPRDSTPCPVVEDEVSCPMFQLLKLSQIGGYPKLLEKLRERQIRAFMDTEKDAIILQGRCPREKLDEFKNVFARMINKVKPENLWEHYPAEEFHDSSRHGLPARQRTGCADVQLMPIDPVEDKIDMETWRGLIRPKVHEFVEGLGMGKTYSVSLVRQSVEGGRPTPTIRFCSASGQHLIARKKFRNKVDMLCDQNRRRRIPVHFSESSTVPLVDAPTSKKAEDSPPVDEDSFPYHRMPRHLSGMSDSLGMKDCPHQSATSGGHFLIDNLPYMLSVGHIYPEPPCGCKQETTTLSSPSLWDLRTLRTRVQKEVQNLELKIRDSAPKRVELDGAIEQLFQGPDAEKLKLYRRFARELNKPDKEFDLGTLEMKCVRNSVRASKSTRYQNDDGSPVFHCMDWSLTVVRKGRQGKNVHRYRNMAEIKMKDFQNEILHPEGAGRPCETTSDFTGNQKVYYVGRTSGLREGRINPEPVELKGMSTTTQEWAIIIDGPDSGNPENFQGDSGAWVLDEAGRLIGVLFAWESQQLLFTPIQDIIEDIYATIPGDHEKNIELYRTEFDDEINRLSKRHVDPPEGPVRVLQESPLPVAVEPENAQVALPISQTPAMPPSPVPSLASSVSTVAENEASLPSLPPLPPSFNAPEAAELSITKRLPSIQSLCWPEDIDISLLKASKQSNFWQHNRRDCRGEIMLNQGDLKRNVRAVKTF